MKQQILLLRSEGKSYKEIAKILGCSTSTVNYHCVKEGVNNIGLGIVSDEFRECLKCKTIFLVKRDKPKQKYCCRNCSDTSESKKNLGRINGLKSASKQNRRSKNEIIFYGLCKNSFNNVINNEPIFNGWDADIVLLDYKIAILWNGRWHYEKLGLKHSVKQVQNRDRIKTQEIIKLGFTPYIIKDMGKYNPKFVTEEFEKLTRHILSLS